MRSINSAINDSPVSFLELFAVSTDGLHWKRPALVFQRSAEIAIAANKRKTIITTSKVLLAMQRERESAEHSCMLTVQSARSVTCNGLPVVSSTIGISVGH